MRIWKWILGVAAGIVLLFVALVLVVTLVVDPNRFKPRIERLVRQATGLPFRISGDLDMAWYPWLALQMGPARLGEAVPLVQWQKARVGARLFPLLRGDLVIDRVRLDGLRLRLERSADGRANWEGLLSARGQSGARGSSPPIGGLEIRNGSVEYVDSAGGTQIVLSDWKLDVGEWKSGRTFSVKSAFGLRQGPIGKPVIRVALEVPAVRLEQDPLSFEVRAFELQLGGARLKGSVALGSTQPVKAQGSVSMETSSLRKLLEDIDVGGPRPRSTEVLTAMKLDARWAANGGAIAVKPIEAQVDETRFTGELVRSAADDPVWTFRLQGDRIDLGRYAALEETDTRPFELPTAALKALRARGVISFAAAKIGTAQLKEVSMILELQDGRLSGGDTQRVR